MNTEPGNITKLSCIYVPGDLNNPFRRLPLTHIYIYIYILKLRRSPVIIDAVCRNDRGAWVAALPSAKSWSKAPLWFGQQNKKPSGKSRPGAFRTGHRGGLECFSSTKVLVWSAKQGAFWQILVRSLPNRPPWRLRTSFD